MDLALFSRIAGILSTPSNTILLLLVLGVLLQATRGRGWGKGLVIIVTMFLVLISLLPVDGWLTAPLEDRFPRPPWPAHVDGVLVLGGGEDLAAETARGAPGFNPNEGQLVSSAELMRRYPGAKLIFSGGLAPLEKGKMSEAGVARHLLDQMGVPLARLTLENRSRNTWENFVYSKSLARPKPGEIWLLVTSAMRMPRAMGVAARLHWHIVALAIGLPHDRQNEWNSLEFKSCRPIGQDRFCGS